MLRIAYLMLAGLVISGCSPADHIRVSSTKLNDVRYEPRNQPVEVFFADTKPNRDFDQIAFIEVKGPIYTSTDTLLSRLKNQAQWWGADAVIAVKKSDTVPVSDSDSPEPLLTGVAVKYK